MPHLSLYMPEPFERLKAALADRYELEHQLGEGGMATVYVAVDLKHDRKVAVKVLRTELAASLGASRFLQEIRATAKLSHPHILALYDSGEADGFLYYVMPLVIGESLRDLLNREMQLAIEDAIRIAREVAKALAHAHDRGLVHRDIKPENILLSEGHAFVADFGISRAVSAAGGASLTQTGMAIGTPAYMSPEQSAADPNVDARSDLYSLGCVLYEMLVGQIPFPAPTAQGMMARHTMDNVPPPSTMRPSITPALEDVILSLLAKTPADRFKTAEALVVALDALHSGGMVTRTATSGFAAKSLRRRVMIPVSALVILVIAAVLGWQLIGGGSGSLTSTSERAVAEPIASIAVLPFDDLSDDSSNEYFADGLADELVDVLSRVEGLRVAPRRSARTFKNTNDDARTIGRQLDVQAILEGNVRKSGERIVITARLVDATDGLQIWNNRYERTVDDVFAVQEEISRSLVSALLGELRGSQDVLTVEALTRNPVAHDKYLWGQFNLSRRTGEGALDAVNNFTMAIGYDSNFADAYSGLSDAHLGVLQHSAEAQGPGTLAAARAAAETALRLNPTLAKARASLGLVKFKSFDWRGAEAEYVRALEIAPEDPLVRQRYADLLATLGRVDGALIHARVAVERDRLSTEAWHTLLRVLRADGQYAEAIRAGQEILQLNANEPQTWLDLGNLFLMEDRPADATDALERYAELGGADPEPFRSFAAAAARFAQDGLAGHLQSAVAAMVQASPVELAVLHQLVGESEEALSVLESAHLERHPDLSATTTRPELAALRDDPRFRAILADIGLTSR